MIAFALLSTTAYKGGEIVYRYGLGVMSVPDVGSGHGHAPGAEHADADEPEEHGSSKEKPHNSDGHAH